MKLQNNMKDEEIKALRDRMIKMESVIPVQVRLLPSARPPSGSPWPHPLCLQDDDVNGEGDGSPPLDGGGAAVPEVRVQRLMEEDPVFRRGRLRWLKQEQQRILNLQQQNVTKKLRGQNPSPGQNHRTFTRCRVGFTPATTSLMLLLLQVRTCPLSLFISQAPAASSPPRSAS